MQRFWLQMGQETILSFFLLEGQGWMGNVAKSVYLHKVSFGVLDLRDFFSIRVLFLFLN